MALLRFLWLRLRLIAQANDNQRREAIAGVALDVNWFAFIP